MPTSAPMGVKFGVEKSTVDSCTVHAKFHHYGCNVSPLRVEISQTDLRAI